MLEVTSLAKRYGDVLALDGCSLQVPAGRLVGLLGPNGAGKTTVMRTLFDLVVPDAGMVRWRGRSARAHGGGLGTCPRSGACTRRCG
jgi:ABC-type multidrug transport system ATPase subunit